MVLAPARPPLKNAAVSLSAFLGSDDFVEKYVENVSFRENVMPEEPMWRRTLGVLPRQKLRRPWSL